ncbi:MAG: tyrosine-protein phosphatase [Chloroflexi bacterium]|nr:tyrosine-protein phosphatase [Chloroflexota bacterium]
MSGTTQSHQASDTGPRARIPLDGTLNTRDIGGWTVGTGAGDHVRHGVVYRSDTHDRLSPADVDHFVCAGVRTVIDLRAEDERHGAGHLAGGLATAGATVHSFPLYDRVSAGALFVPAAEGISHPLEAFYRTILVRHTDAIRSVIEILADPANLPAIIHCTAGKDRTGVVVALLLSVAGVDDETIIDDYARTGANLTEEWMEARRGDASRYGLTWEALKPALETPPEAMRATLAHVREQFGSAAGYLVSIGVAPESVSRIRANLTEMPTS